MAFWPDSDNVLPAQPKSLEDLLVAFGGLAAKVGEMASTFAHHLDQATPGMLIMPVHLQMLSQLVNPSRQHRDLYFRGAGIIGRKAVLLEDRFFFTFT